jgi:hypothetical protein
MTFDGVGGMTESGKVLTIGHDATGLGVTPATQSEFTTTGTYAVNADGTFTISKNSAFTTLTGPSAGAVGTVTGILAEGVILPGRRVLISTMTTPTVETVTNTTLNFSVERICHRTAHFFAQ